MPTTPAQQAHYQKNRKRYIEQAAAQRVWMREFLYWLKSHPCQDCGIQYNPWQMQFDHIGSDKVASVTKISYNNNVKALLDEIRKCELVCANCHADRTHKRAVVA